MNSSNGDSQRVDGRRLRYQNRRAEILDAAMAHLLENGINGMSFRALAAAVGVSHVTLRHHFGTKDELLGEIFGAIGSRLAVPDHFDADDIESIVQKLLLRSTQPETDRRTRLVFEVYGQAVQDPVEYRAFLDRMVTGWIEIIRDHALKAGCPHHEADNFATLLFAQIRGLQFDLLATGDNERIAAAFNTVIDGLRFQHARWAGAAQQWHQTGTR
ncbi:TetR/AcrR family transcriptional regulator [Mycobacterium spongiae]|uniref:TetR family transcriptional regulator n=1 Tax=Mycobacterium spongiae TaxID=886343 RepID=A0A975JYP3_9MYCO|nr:TetR/AcrR family transcriptional regulator [Mycobacterium spongiae]QUR68146.1 TetR family transcriptional regulator [Mycobacterium spongiae]